ncbi:DNA polymerase, beta domain protein region [Kribbella flavida DSM 17836]|uniref:DNA polymerase, beta domain protein region n=1 Tax=Kribbella flavida (strain DSM 17836 / JCM 10339 / NBRC 14399) TaxID=479435 RepID=D2PRR7_KRIFD|nr:winged helix-turn-helix transcriptional regulator [Kribbella flavida]ADB29247.1 DNA polymerase, beta domain protein region [Kribbella flavida DSM 17836]
MVSAAPPLLPIFRSDAQARILSWLLLVPEREQPIATLVPVAGVAQSNVLREVNRLVSAGLLTERRAGPTRLVSANRSSPYFEPLVQLLGRAFGPASLVPEELEQVPGVERAVIAGSWARRFHGEPGPPPNDVDVVVVGEPDRRRLRRANARLEERLGTPVQVTVVTSEEWDSQSSGFLQEVRTRPHLTVIDNTLGE